jgi:hypothetical protein
MGNAAGWLGVLLWTGFRIRSRNVFGKLDPDPHLNKNSGALKGLSHEIDFKTFDKNLQNLA